MSEEERRVRGDGGLTRRDVVLAGGAAAGFGIGRASDDNGATGAGQDTGETQQVAKVFAKPEGTTLKVFGTELGTPWYEQTPFVTPHELFFVRNRYPSPAVDPNTWTLEVKGDATEEAVQLLFWSGVDGPDTGRPIAMEAVLERPDEIGLAFGLNGLIPLPADHGGPVRALVPGWGGAASVKWLTEIRISSHRFWTRMHTREEALIGPQWPREEFDENEDEFLGAAPEDIQGEGGTWQNTKSFLAFPYAYKLSEPPGRYILAQGDVPTLPAGQHTMRGYANSPFGIAKVEYSVDDGPWQEATLVEPTGLPYSRVRFEFPWDATQGTHVLATRATDKEGNVQPERVPRNQLGILCNAIAKFEVEVT